MGVDAGDYNGDGRLDLVVTNFAQDTNTLYGARDNGQFEDVTSAAGLAGPTFVRMGWGVAFFDADLDGRPDLFFANGHIYPNVDEYPQLQESFRQPNQLFWNTGTGFADVSATAGSGLQVAKASRGLALGDLDNDGDLDLVVTNIDDTPTVLRNQQRTGNHWVEVQLERPPAIASASAHASSLPQVVPDRFGRSDPAGAISRRTICVRISAWGHTTARSTSRFGCPGAECGSGAASQSTEC